MPCEKHRQVAADNQLIDVATVDDPMRAWVLRPKTRDTMASYYLELKHRVETETREEWLRYLHNEMWTVLAREHLANGQYAQLRCQAAMGLSVDELRASIHRAGCFLLRFLASQAVCLRPCCCGCPAAYDGIYCIGRINGKTNETDADASDPEDT